MTRDEQRELEMARGREVARRHALEEEARQGLNVADAGVADRRETLARWEEGRKLSYRDVSLSEVTREIALADDFQYDREAYVGGTMVVSERAGPAWPSESYVAQIGLAIGALSNFQGVPELSEKKRRASEDAARALQERKRRDEHRNRNNAMGWKAIHEPDKR